MIVANSIYRPDPARAIFLSGTIDDEQISRLTPRILNLQSRSRDPIAVYILDSPGGSVSSMETILRLLNSSDQNFSGPCHIITVVTRRAASAAADLLASGDYAIAYPTSTILYHGIRTPLREATAESTSMLAHILRLGNDRYAMELARKIELRFMFRFATLKHEFDGVREKLRPKLMTDLECFLDIISSNLSRKAKKVFDKAFERFGRYESLISHVTKKCEPATGKEHPAKVEADRIKAIVDFELDSNKEDSTWTFKDGGLGRLADDFFILNEYLETHETDRLIEWCNRYGKFAISPSEIAQIDQIADETARNAKMIETVRPLLQPVWSFFVALCHALQEGENELTAIDAYWLGLVDEVMGEEDLSGLRLLGEHQPDPPTAEQLELRNEETSEEIKGSSSGGSNA